MTRIAGLASNRGRNLINIHESRPGGAELAVVLSNDANAPILSKAETRDIPSISVERKAGETRFEHERRINDELDAYDYDLVCLDGYMRILSQVFLDAQPLTLNVHPSLLPSFPGMDAWGDALDAGVDLTGCTVHVVTDATDGEGNVIEEEIDAGPIVTQEPIPVLDGDDRDSLKERVLYEGEFKAYPRAIGWFADGRLSVDDRTGTVSVDTDSIATLPVRYLESADRTASLRYGENPHQDAAVYVDYAHGGPSVVSAEQLNGSAKALSYNNYNDADAALDLVREFDEPASAVIKHTNPAGCAIADSIGEAYDRALSTDPMSAFGGIVALNRSCDAATADAITDSFKEVVVAPGYDADALDILRRKENLRVLDVGEFEPHDPDDSMVMEKHLAGGRLLQERDTMQPGRADLTVVTERAPTDEQLETMLFAWRVLKHVKSNGIVFAVDTETVGIGMGQVSRVDAVKLAAMKAEEHAEGKGPQGAVMASDAFFPFPDGVDAAVDVGIDAVIQPGGSVNDEDVIAAADERDVAMVFTGVRCFRHD